MKQKSQYNYWMIIIIACVIMFTIMFFRRLFKQYYRGNFMEGFDNHSSENMKCMGNECK